MINKAKVYILCVFAFLITGVSRAQVQFEWVTGIPWKDGALLTTGFDGDLMGNIIYPSTFTDTFTYNSILHTAIGSSDLILAKLDSNGIIQWVKTAGGPDNDVVHHSCTDSQENIYITGIYRDTAYFDGDTITTTSYQDQFFLAKYDPFGNELWVRTCTGYATVGDRVRCDNNDNVIVIVYFIGSLHFDTTSITLPNGTDAGTCLIKFDANGNFLWMKGGKNVYLEDLGCTAQNDIIAHGNSFLPSTTYWGNDNEGYIPFTPFGSTLRNLITVKLNAAGDLLWKFNEGGTDDSRGHQVLVYPDGAFCTAGTFKGTATIAGQQVTTTFYSTWFTAFYDSAHAGRWVKPVVVTPAGTGHGIQIFKSGNLILTDLYYSSSPVISCQYSGINFPASTGYDESVNLGSCDTAGSYMPWVKDTMEYPYIYLTYGFYTSPTNATYMRGTVNNAFIFNSGDTLTGVNQYYDAFVAKLGNNFSTSVNALNPENEDLAVFPNPSADYVVISSQIHKKLNASVYSITGEKIMDTVIHGYGTITMPHSSGIYLLKIEGENFISTRKIVKQ
ncbi:MAG TPA: T9SS type A sorting domain-containing protein [Bacteroidia bacterium]|nr:T9SS type A sorting domain-containing protein [Bacteroidia bacterium]